jgi:hypothetical protein
MTVKKQRRQRTRLSGDFDPPEEPIGSQRFDEPGDDVAPAPEALDRYRRFAEALSSGLSFDDACGQSRDQQIYHAYHESILLAAFKPQVRDGWSVCREKRLADILGPWRRYDVLDIDIPSLVKVDEWVECQAQLLQRGRELSDRQKSEIERTVAWVEAQLADCPATTIFGVIAKLMVWRRRHARALAHDRDFQRRHALAFAAYGDLIRLTGLYSLTVKEDRDAGLVGHAPMPIASQRKVRKYYVGPRCR